MSTQLRSVNDTRYTAAAIVLHWAIALAIISNLALAQWMQAALDDAARQAAAVAAFQVHKSIGLTVLALSLARLGLRWIIPPPAMPAGMSTWQRRAAQGTHVLFYLLMIGIPLSGWVLVSTQWRDGSPLVVPTLWFGVVEVPHLFGLDAAADARRSAVYGGAVSAHTLLARLAFVLLLLHVGAALKHQWIDRDGLLTRMAPWSLPSDSPSRRWSLRAGGAALGLAVVAILAQQFRSTAPETADQDIAAVAGSWPVLAESSEIAFSGTHSGKAFRGRFTRWQSNARFDLEAIDSSTIVVTVETASASDGVALHDQTLPGSEWFDVENHPTAEYRSTTVRQANDGSYLVDGTLTIKGESIPIDGLQLSLDDSGVTISGSIAIDRADVDLGMDSDAEGAWVSRSIAIDVATTFRPPG